jgi:DNA replication protein DnaC
MERYRRRQEAGVSAIPESSAVSIPVGSDALSSDDELHSWVFDPHAIQPGELPFWQRYLATHWSEFASAQVDPTIMTELTSALGISMKGLYIHGPTGTGKTYQLAGIFTWLCDGFRYGDPVLISAADMMEQIQADFDKAADARGEARYFREADVLLIDDVGAGRATEWSVSAMGQIIEHRQRNNRLTFFTSNYSRQGLGAHFDAVTRSIEGERLASRIGRMCIEIGWTGPDRRVS